MADQKQDQQAAEPKAEDRAARRAQVEANLGEARQMVARLGAAERQLEAVRRSVGDALASDPAVAGRATKAIDAAIEAVRAELDGMESRFGGKGKGGR